MLQGGKGGEGAIHSRWGCISYKFSKLTNDQHDHSFEFALSKMTTCLSKDIQ